MSLFGMRKPRGFSPPAIYVDERRERVERLLRKASGDIPYDQDFDAGGFRLRWQEATSRLKCRRKRMSVSVLVWLLVIAAMIVCLLIH